MIRYKRFTFRQRQHAGRNTHEVEILTERDFERRTYEITDATYNRFASLVNRGVVDATILPASNGIVWEIVRI